jgi:hypothetical protein
MNGFQPLDSFFIPPIGYAGEFGPMFFVEAIPEPSTFVLIGSCIVALGIGHRALPRGHLRSFSRP